MIAISSPKTPVTPEVAVLRVNSGTRKHPHGEVQLEQLLSVEEAARRLGGISKWTIHAWLSNGKILRTKVGARTMIRESELLKVIEDGGKSPAPRREDVV